MNKFMSIPYDEKVSLQFSGAFYYRIQALIIEYCKDKKDEEIVSALQDIKDGLSNEDPWVFHFETLMILIKELEDKFINEKKVNYSETPEEIMNLFKDSTQDSSKENE